MIPAFHLADQDGRQRAFEDLRGPKGLVLFAYPKDNSSG
jgi:peroxiredoxin